MIFQRPEVWPEEFLEHCKWYPEHFSVINNKSEKVPMQLWDTQMVPEFVKWEAMRRKEPVFIIILKARQQGLSTWCSGSLMRDAIERENRRSLIIAHDDKASKNVLSMSKRFQQFFPDGLPTSEMSASAMTLRDTNSQFVVYTAGTRDSTARSFSCQAIEFSELDFYPDGDAVLVSAMQVVPSEYPAVVVIESTANGPGGPMQKHWDRAVAGVSGFIPIFLSWFDDPRYSRELSYKDLIAFGPRPYVEEHRSYLEACALDDEKVVKMRRERKEKADALGSGSGVGPAQRGRDAEGDGGESAGGTQRGGKKGAASAGAEGTARDGVDDDPATLPQEGAADGGRHEVQGADGGDYVRPGDDGRSARRDGESVSDRVQRERDAGHRRRVRRRHNLVGKRLDTLLDKVFEESLTPYEQGLIEEFGRDRITFEQINWMRWCTQVKCTGDEIKRRREYPSRPDEAFEASGDSVLDPVTIAKWQKQSSEEKPKFYRFDVTENREGAVSVATEEDPLAKTRVWEEPEDGVLYCMGVDPSGGHEDGDWTVACVLRVDSGEQVAEFRARMDTDLAIDQIEGLGIYFNEAYTGVEVNSYGMPYARSLEDRGTLPMFEREVPDRKEPGKMNKMIGWLTGPKTRDALYLEVRRAFRLAVGRVRSMATLQEARTLTVVTTQSRLERIEARPNCHDDGIMAYGVARMMRNRIMPTDQDDGPEVQKEDDAKIGSETVRAMLNAALDRDYQRQRLPLSTRHIRHIHAGRATVDGRRNVL